MANREIVTPGELIRACGGALALAGVFEAVGAALHPDDTAATLYLSSARWAPAHVSLALSYLLAVFGLMGLYLRQREGAGRLGLAGFILAEAGCALLVGVTLAEAFILPVIAPNQSPRPLAEWLDPTGPLAGAVTMSLLALICYNAGFVILGMVTERAGILPRRAGFLLALATVLSNGEFFGSVGFAIYVGAGILSGVALAWLGVGLRKVS